MAIAGDSAGGTLAAVVAILARDAGLKLALQALITPGTTAHADTASHAVYAEGFLLEKAGIDWFFDQYIDRAQRSDWRFAPLEADDLEGVAPAWIGLAECDPLVDEGVAYGDRLRLAGVAVDLEIWRGVTHDFIKMGRAIPEARRAQQAQRAVPSCCCGSLRPTLWTRRHGRTRHGNRCNLRQKASPAGKRRVLRIPYFVLVLLSLSPVFKPDPIHMD